MDTVTYKEYEVAGKIVPVSDGTRRREKPTTFTTVLGSYPKNTQVEIDLVREYTNTVSSQYVKAGDKWGRVTKINGVAVAGGWMAIVYQGVTICAPYYQLVTVPPVPGEKQKIVSLTVVPHYEDGTAGPAEDYYPEAIA